MEDINQYLRESVGNMARKNYRVMELFIAHGIDFFCKGTQNLQEALAELEIATEPFLEELEEVQQLPIKQYGVDVETWPLGLLADYIQKTHHPFTEKTCIAVKEDLQAMKGAASKKATELFPLFNALAAGLGAHMKKEELMLFPAIRKLETNRPGQPIPKFESVQRFVDNMLHDHDEQFEQLKSIRQFLDNYAVTGSEEFDQTITQIKALDIDLAHHIHLENNILFPKAVELAKSLN